MGLLRVIRKTRIKERELRVLILGLDNAGKSTVLKQLSGEDINAVEPTLGFKIKTVNTNGFRINFWDVGGQESLRPFWRNYFEESDALIWVVDSADLERMSCSRDEIAKVLDEGQMAGTTLLVLANKQDIKGADSPQQVWKQLSLETLGASKSLKILGCSAHTGQGLQEGLNWLVKDVSKRIYGN